MAEQAVVEKPVEKPVESKPVDKPVADAAKATPEQKPAVEDKAKPADVKVTTPEQKPAEELKSLLDEAGEEEKPAEAAKVVVPDKYEFKLPEGMTLDEATMALVVPEFKALGLDNTQAQKLVDLQLKLTKGNEEAHVQEWQAYLETQKTEAKTYFGIKLPEVMRNVARARDAFLSKPMQEKLNVAGFSNDKDFLETLDKIGRVIGEGKFVDGKRSAPAKGKAGETMEQVSDSVSLDKVYPSMSKT